MAGCPGSSVSLRTPKVREILNFCCRFVPHESLHFCLHLQHSLLYSMTKVISSAVSILECFAVFQSLVFKASPQIIDNEYFHLREKIFRWASPPSVNTGHGVRSGTWCVYLCRSVHTEMANSRSNVSAGLTRNRIFFPLKI